MSVHDVGNGALTPERARQLVLSYTGNGRPEVVAAIVDRMLSHGEGVWHATAVVTKTEKSCWCYHCDLARKAGAS